MFYMIVGRTSATQISYGHITFLLYQLIQEHTMGCVSMTVYWFLLSGQYIALFYLDNLWACFTIIVHFSILPWQPTCLLYHDNSLVRFTIIIHWSVLP